MAIRCTGCNARHFSLPNATGATVATCPECEAQAAPYREELTAAGPQLVIPGCERQPPKGPAQLSLFA